MRLLKTHEDNILKVPFYSGWVPAAMLPPTRSVKRHHTCRGSVQNSLTYAPTPKTR